MKDCQNNSVKNDSNNIIIFREQPVNFTIYNSNLQNNNNNKLHFKPVNPAGPLSY